MRIDPLVASDALLAASVFVAFVALALLVADAIAAALDARSVRDEDDPELLTRRRIRELARSVAVAAALAVAAGFAVDAAARLVWEGDDPLGAALILIAVTVAAFLVGVVAVVAVVRRERPSYARLRRDLRDRAALSLSEEELAEFEARLARADRMRERRGQSALPLRLVGLVVVPGLAVLMWLSAHPGVAVAFTAASLVAIAAFVVATRADAVRREALDRVLAAQRAEVAALLERARIPQRRRVPGLRDRVSRALAILREQQR